MSSVVVSAVSALGVRNVGADESFEEETALDAAVILGIRNNTFLEDADLEAVRAIWRMYNPRTTGKLARMLGMTTRRLRRSGILERLQKARVIGVHRNGRLGFTWNFYKLKHELERELKQKH